MSTTPTVVQPPLCTGCNKHPNEIQEYIDCAEDEGITPDEFIVRMEGTYNPGNGHFLCTSCYMAAGMPSSPRGWRAP